MSDVETKAWTWDVSNVEEMTLPEIKLLLENRNCDMRKLPDGKNQILTHLMTHFEIDDKNLKPFNELSDDQIKAELMVRCLSPAVSIRGTSKQELIDRLDVNKLPSIGKLLVFGYIRKEEIVLERGLFIPHYLKELVVSFCESTVISLYLSPNYPNNIFIASINNQKNQNLKLQIMDISNTNSNTNNTRNDDNKKSLICSARSKSLILPSNIQQNIRKFKKYNNDRFYMIFQINQDFETSMMVINESEIQQHLNGIYHHTVP